MKINILSSYLFAVVFSSCYISSGDSKVSVSIDLAERHKDLKITNAQAIELLQAIDGVYAQDKTAIVFMAATAVCGSNKEHKMSYHIDYIDQRRTICLTYGGKSIPPATVDYKGFKEHIFPTTQFIAFTIKCSRPTTFKLITEIATK